MKNLKNKLPRQTTALLFCFQKPAGLFETTTSGTTTSQTDPTNTTATILTSTHIFAR